MTQIIRQYSAINNSICITENYLLNGLLHNDNGPATIFYNEDGYLNSEHYYQLNKLHRDNAPASIFYHDSNNRLLICTKVFYQHGKKHNTNGPARISYDTNGYITKKQYYFLGKLINENTLANAGYFKTNDQDTKAFIMSML